MFGFLKKKKPAEEPGRFPPVPAWRPAIVQPLDRVAERIRYYTEGRGDFALCRHGTAVLLPDGIPADAARRHVEDVLHKIFHAHPDMNPLTMDDGNVLVRYNHPAMNVVLRDVVEANRAEIDRRHQDALATHEVLITPMGPNVFDEVGKMALFGRCYMFMDAQQPEVVRIERKDVP